MTVIYLIAVINTRKVLILWEGNKDCLITHITSITFCYLGSFIHWYISFESYNQS